MSTSTNTAKKPSPEKEVWKSPPSLKKPWVEVSNFGRVRTLDRYVDYVRRQDKAKRHDFHKGCIRKLCKDTRGRPIYCCGDPDNTCRLIKTLVAECFVPNKNPAYYKYIFHKDRDRTNCRADNLYWGHSIAEEECVGKKVGIFEAGGREPISVGGLTKIGRELGVSKQAIWMAIKEGRLCRGAIVKYVGDDVEAAEAPPVSDKIYADIRLKGHAVFKTSR